MPLNEKNFSHTPTLLEQLAELKDKFSAVFSELDTRHKQQTAALNTEFQLSYETIQTSYDERRNAMNEQQTIERQKLHDTAVALGMSIPALAVSASSSVTTSAQSDAAAERPRSRGIPKVIAGMLDSRGRSMTIAQIAETLTKYHSWSGTLQSLRVIMCNGEGRNWKRTGRGRYGSKIKQTRPSSKVGRSKYAHPVHEMVLEAVRNARGGEPVSSDDISTYIEQNYGPKLEYQSITPLLYTRLRETGQVKKVSERMFQAA